MRYLYGKYIMLLNNYKGRLLIAQPKCDSNFFKESVVLITRHNSYGAWGIIINKPVPDPSCDLIDVFEHVGMENAVGANAPLYVGGPIERNRICLVHSNDWASNSTLEISPELSVTTDISILAAISEGIGPSRYRACCGVSSWGPNQLEGEMKGQDPWTLKHRWLEVQGTEKNVFETEPSLQWNTLLTQAVELEVKEWF